MSSTKNNPKSIRSISANSGSSLIKKIRGFYILARPRYTFFVVLVAFAGMVFETRSISYSVILPLFIIGLHYIAVCIKDDIEDYEVDLKLDKGRPLVQKSVSLREAYSAWIGLHLLSLPLALFVNMYFFILMALYAYTTWKKYHDGIAVRVNVTQQKAVVDKYLPRHKKRR